MFGVGRSTFAQNEREPPTPGFERWTLNEMGVWIPSPSRTPGAGGCTLTLNIGPRRHRMTCRPTARTLSLFASVGLFLTTVGAHAQPLPAVNPPAPVSVQRGQSLELTLSGGGLATVGSAVVNADAALTA